VSPVAQGGADSLRATATPTEASHDPALGAVRDHRTAERARGGTVAAGAVRREALEEADEQRRRWGHPPRFPRAKPAFRQVSPAHPTESKGDRRFDVVIPVHGRHELARRAIRSVIENNARSVARMIVVDDGSRMPLTFARPTEVPVVHLRNERAAGFLAAIELGMRHGREEFVLFLNSDAVLVPGLLAEVLRSGTDWDVLGFLGQNAAEFSVPPRRAGPLDRVLLRYPQVKDFDRAAIEEMIACFLKDRNVETIVEARRFHGFCFIVRRSTIARIGGLAGTCPPSGRGLETDLSLRIADAGGRVATYVNRCLPHAGSGSTSTLRRIRDTMSASLLLRLAHGTERIRWSRLAPVEVRQLQAHIMAAETHRSGTD